MSLENVDLNLFPIVRLGSGGSFHNFMRYIHTKIESKVEF